MRCKNCGKRFALGSHGMGFSDPPGCFFAIVVSCLVAGSLAAFYATRGSVVGIVIAVFCGLTAFYATGGVITGMGNNGFTTVPNARTVTTRLNGFGPGQCDFTRWGSRFRR